MRRVTRNQVCALPAGIPADIRAASAAISRIAVKGKGRGRGCCVLGLLGLLGVLGVLAGLVLLTRRAGRVP
jgi:hypothetical protein